MNGKWFSVVRYIYFIFGQLGKLLMELKYSLSKWTPDNISFFFVLVRVWKGQILSLVLDAFSIPIAKIWYKNFQTETQKSLKS